MVLIRPPHDQFWDDCQSWLYWPPSAYTSLNLSFKVLPTDWQWGELYLDMSPPTTALCHLLASKLKQTFLSANPCLFIDFWSSEQLDPTSDNNVLVEMLGHDFCFLLLVQTK